MLKLNCLFSEGKVNAPVHVLWCEYNLYLHRSTANLSGFVLVEQSFDLLTSHQWGPELFMRSTHIGSDFEKASMSSRFSQETLRATLVTQSVALGPGAPTAAITAWRGHTGTERVTWLGHRTDGHKHRPTASQGWRGTFTVPHPRYE